MKRTILTWLITLLTLPMWAGGGALLEIADDLYSRLAYSKAADYYERYLEKNEEDLYAWQQLASCYDLVNDYEKLEATLAEVVTMEEPSDSSFLLAYAEVLQIRGNCEEAVKWYGKYLDRVPDDRRAARQRAVCVENPGLLDPSGVVRYRVENMPFNTDAFEYAPNLFNKTLLYTTTNADDIASKKVFGWTGGSYSDLYQYERDSLEVFILFNEMDEINTKYNDGPFTVDPVTEDFYYTRNNYDPDKAFKKRGINEFNYMNLKIYIAENNLGKIGAVREFPYNSSDYNTGHPAISPDGAYLVFVSDQPEGNIGGRDLYVCRRDTSGWSAPELLTSDINTEGDEMFPHFRSDGSLFFASDGLGSLGGLDIYRADIDLNTNTLRALEHLGDDINTSYDDFAIVFEKNGRKGYFASDRPSGNGKDDIYSFEDMTILLQGVVVNAETGEKLPGSDFYVMEGGTEIISGLTDDKAGFETLVYKDRLYQVGADEDYFHPAEVEVSTANIHGNGPVKVTVRLQPIRYTVKVVDDLTGTPIAGARVEMEFDGDHPEASVFTRADGTRAIPVYKDCGYSFMAKADGYLATYLEWTSPSEDSDQEVVIRVHPITYEPMALRNIYYDFDKSYLRLKESTADLEKLLRFLNDNPELKIQINSHTDARASHAYNIDLSQRRAQSVVNWLKLRGIADDRIIAKGFGETQPVNHCVDGVRCSEEEHQLNRRTEFQVVNQEGETELESESRDDIEVDPCKNCPF